MYYLFWIKNSKIKDSFGRLSIIRFSGTHKFIIHKRWFCFGPCMDNNKNNFVFLWCLDRNFLTALSSISVPESENIIHPYKFKIFKVWFSKKIFFLRTLFWPNEAHRKTIIKSFQYNLNKKNKLNDFLRFPSRDVIFQKPTWELKSSIPY